MALAIYLSLSVSLNHNLLENKLNDYCDKLAAVTIVMQDVGEPFVKAAQNDARDRALAALLMSGIGGVGGGLAGYFSGGEKRKRKALLGALLGAGLGAGTPYAQQALSDPNSEVKPKTADEPTISPEDRAKAEQAFKGVAGDLQSWLKGKSEPVQKGVAGGATAGSAYLTHKKLAPWLEKQIGGLQPVTERLLGKARLGNDAAQTAVREYLETGGAAGIPRWKELGYQSADDFMASFVKSAPSLKPSLLGRLLRGSKGGPSPLHNLDAMGNPIKPAVRGESLAKFFEGVARKAKATSGVVKDPTSLAKSFRQGVSGAGAKSLPAKSVGWAARLGVPLTVATRLWPGESSQMSKGLE